MIRVLFVDDEIAILEGLRNVLRGERKRWVMKFAEGGKAALDLLANEAFDVIVTDMRMPGMDGLALLRHVRQSHPRMTRIVLSGYSELGQAAEASVVAHQMLMKPCDADVLRNAIDRALRVQALLSNEALRGLVGGLGTLPSAPRMYQALTVALADPNADVKKLAAIVEQDVGMSSRVLKFANSAYFGFPKRISSIESAIVCLGTNAVRHLALTFEVFSAWGSQGDLPFDQLERHSLLTARIARKMANDRAQAEVAFAAGLLHDAGRMVLMSRGREPFAAAVEEARRRHVPLHVAEASVFGATHAEVGAYLLGLWDLPHNVVEPVALHHAPVPGQPRSDTSAIVALANVLAHEALEWKDGDGEADTERVDLDGVDDVARWRELAHTEAHALA
jgi:putative nucleotidyltransferase with HDIG domain